MPSVSRLVALALPAVLAAALAPGPARAEADGRFRLAVPAELARSGLLDHVLPRFSLKTATRIERVGPDAEADARFGTEGTPVFEGPDQTWHLAPGADPDAATFADWLASDVGRGTVARFERDGATPFRPVAAEPETAARPTFDGDAAEGQRVALAACGRCHVVSEENRMDAIGSTPSFAVLRTFPDWIARFQGFYALNPHPAFTQVAEVTTPFAAHAPSPIVPVEITLDELDDIVAFVERIPPADLGAPVEAR
ncbi:hypothetical protein ROJ8625_03870 [Roseivivax jejudonensis]|uniref:Cytochrome c domain-containing protein n=1 Tax=Roseivivax jejudonensis TaxID=1529041 RepID=A0A1X7A8I5_9RHOB|nr:hypothetical protein [Roseivivax jejudonensis]SLN72706.1 hypothetical protein ROJ8625_03870 [Roseivivax jejudonensis]